MTNIITVLGADRVGKTTLCESLTSYLSKNDKAVQLVHFSGPKPHHRNPIEQYTHIIGCFKDKNDWIICDRGGAEVCFYENYRRGFDIPIEWALKYEYYIQANFIQTRTIYLKKDWKEIENFHIEEIRKTYQECSDYWMSLCLGAREKEHYAYYDYMDNYFLKYAIEQPLIITNNKLTDDLLTSIFIAIPYDTE